MKGEGNVLSQAEKWKTICVTGMGNLPFCLFPQTHTKTQTHQARTTLPTAKQIHKKTKYVCLPRGLLHLQERYSQWFPLFKYNLLNTQE